jgi:hypothetical protein
LGIEEWEKEMDLNMRRRKSMKINNRAFITVLLLKVIFLILVVGFVVRLAQICGV